MRSLVFTIASAVLVSITAAPLEELAAVAAAGSADSVDSTVSSALSFFFDAGAALALLPLRVFFAGALFEYVLFDLQ